MLRTVVSVASTIVLASCAGAQGGDAGLLFDPCQPLQLVHEEDVADEEVESLVAATTSWNQHAATRLEVTSAPVPDAAILPVYFESAAPLFYGVYEPSSGEIYINRRMPSEQARAITITHELGHAFGLEHVSDRPSLMNEGNLKTDILAPDVDELNRLWSGCAAATAESGAN